MEKIGKLIFTKDFISDKILVKDLFDNFLRGTIKDSIAICNNDKKPIGLIIKQKFLTKLTERYAFELYQKKEIIKLATPDFLAVSYDEPLDSVVNKALKRKTDNVYDEIVVINQMGEYEGLVSIKNLIIEQTNNLANLLVQQELAQAKTKELEAINEIKNQFISNVTHELRSPTNVIIGALEILKKNIKDNDLKNADMIINILETSANSLKIVISNILDLSKIEAGKIEVIPEKFKLDELIKDILDNASILKKNKQIDLIVQINEDLELYTDYVKLRQILLNLVSNAIKFTEKGYIKISSKNDNDQVIIEVEDTGCGIKKENQDKLFVAFSQVEDAKTKKYEGTGLGLTIVKKLVGLLQGEVYFESEWKKGSKFGIKIPIELKEKINEEKNIYH